MSLPLIQSADWPLAWRLFVTANRLNEGQAKQFERYLELLLEWNQLFNITAITDPQRILDDHFTDSLALINVSGMTEITGLVDVGSGGGFPGIPLKIMLPHILVVLVEVNSKKRTFLQEIVKQLALENVIISELDWRTFIIKTDYPVDVVCARASLRPDELIRMFGPSSHYQNAQLVYWASSSWSDDQGVLKNFKSYEQRYTSGDGARPKERKLVVVYPRTGIYPKK
jgi:16S rRNA (guanine(527)-N(7))-methyltransferase RsmG